MDGGTLLLIVLVGLPAISALMSGGFTAAIVVAIVAFAGCAIFTFHPLWGGGIWIAAWIVGVMIGSSRDKRRRSERQHRELLEAIAKGQRVEPPPR